MTKEHTHYIGGKNVKGTSGRFGDVFNPSKGEVASKCPLASSKEMQDAISSAEQAFPGWSQTSVVRR
ncbi:MAG: aldehyde dehydrogenase family protein, partial [Alphaproteobacteria bacterium]